MKKLLMLVLIVATASGAFAQIDPGQLSIGIYFGAENMPGLDPFAQSDYLFSYTYTPLGTFWAHVIVLGLGGYSQLAGYELGILVPDETDDFYAMGGWDFMGVGAGIDATYPGLPGSYCRAHGYTVPRPINTVGHYMILMKARFRNSIRYGYSYWQLGPWGVTTLMPKIVADGIEMYVPLWLCDYSDGWAVCAGWEPTAAQTRTWSEVKSLFD